MVLTTTQKNSCTRSIRFHGQQQHYHGNVTNSEGISSTRKLTLKIVQTDHPNQEIPFIFISLKQINY
jgi:hypothetical protein